MGARSVSIPQRYDQILNFRTSDVAACLGFNSSKVRSNHPSGNFLVTAELSFNSSKVRSNLTSPDGINWTLRSFNSSKVRSNLDLCVFIHVLPSCFNSSKVRSNPVQRHCRGSHSMPVSIPQRYDQILQTRARTDDLGGPVSIPQRYDQIHVAI